MESFFELAFVDRDLAEAVQRNSAREWIGRHVKYRIEVRLGLVPIAEVVTIEFSEVTQRRRISRIHRVRTQVEFLGDEILRTVFGDEPALHGPLDQGTPSRVENGNPKLRGVTQVRNIVYAQLPEFLRGSFRFARKHALLFEHRLKELNSVVFLARSCLRFRFVQLLIEGCPSSLHFRIEDLLYGLHF